MFVILALDLGVLNRKAHVVSIREALTFTIGLVILALCFNGVVYLLYENHWLGLGATVDKVDGVVNDGRLAAVKFLTGYVIELSLSADNVFVIAMIFQYLRVPPQYQHRVLFWGILGALVMRGGMILLGTALIARYHWILYLFGAFLVFTAARMLFGKDGGGDPADSLVMRWLRRFFPITPTYHEQHFVIVEHGKRILTPLAVALVLVETTDLVFAVDSIPAIFAITTDPFIVFAANAFAMLGLRALYFLLVGVMDRFVYLSQGLAVILAIIGAKMLLIDVWHVPIWLSLTLIVVILGVTAVLSLRAERHEERQLA